ncbi:MAG: hypothetical protein HKN82_03020 [Akkermansiaceae bacterium]|nr:hypothetical protein [Akkermansiaceae bacterium]
MPTIRILLAVLAAVLPALAGPHTVKKESFEATVDLTGVFLPVTGHPIQIDPAAWTDFTILEVKEQGAPVKKGEAVMVVDTKSIDRAIADGEADAKLRKLALANAERELENLEVSTSWRLASAKRSYQRTKEDLEYFRKTRKPLSIEEAHRLVDRYERYLEYESEELSQLRKMYAEDDLTEETEEIILRRQENAVKDAEFSLKRARVSRDRALETEVPRESVDLEQNFKDAELRWNTRQEILPRELEQKRLEVKKSRLEDQRANENLAEIQDDRKLMNITAPTAGRVYYGEFLHGKWNAATAAKVLKPGGKLPARTTIATVVPNHGPLLLNAAVPEAEVAKLQPGQKGFASPTSAPRRRIPIEVQTVASHPAVDNTYRTVFKLGGIPKGLRIVPGMQAKVKVKLANGGKALTVPAKAVVEKADGSFAVKVQPEEGKPTERRVELGVESGGKIKVLAGLKEGEVVLVPDEKKEASQDDEGAEAKGEAKKS